TRSSLVPGQRSGALITISLAGLCSVAFVAVSAGQNTTAKAAAGAGGPFAEGGQPLLSNNCYPCHSGNVPMGNLNLAAFNSEATAEGKPEVWEKVLEKLKAGKMPPPGQPVPSKAEVTPVTGWIEGFLASANAGKAFDPGRVTARRLNRVEYDNTIHDLLGVAGIERFA